MRRYDCVSCSFFGLGWIPQGDFVGTGLTTGDVDVLLYWPNIQVNAMASINIMCGISCCTNVACTSAVSTSQCQLKFDIGNATNPSLYTVFVRRLVTLITPVVVLLRCPRSPSFDSLQCFALASPCWDIQHPCYGIKILSHFK